MFFAQASKLYLGDHMNLIWYLLFYSLLGFCGEVLYARLTRSAKPDRKCRLFCPICPVYGIGATVITQLPSAITDRPIVYFLTAALVATAVEYLLGAFYERVWGVSFWNYDGMLGNIQGRVCLPFALLWGALSLALLPNLHPIAQRMAAMLPNSLLVPVLLLLTVDFCLTGLVLRRSHDTNALIWYR